MASEGWDARHHRAFPGYVPFGPCVSPVVDVVVKWQRDTLALTDVLSDPFERPRHDPKKRARHQ
jgi:hypothetical protein